MVEGETPSLGTNIPKKSAEALQIHQRHCVETYGVGFEAGLAPGPPNELMVGMTKTQSYVVTTSPFLVWSLSRIE